MWKERINRPAKDKLQPDRLRQCDKTVLHGHSKGDAHGDHGRDVAPCDCALNCRRVAHGARLARGRGAVDICAASACHVIAASVRGREYDGKIATLICREVTGASEVYDRS